MGNCLSLGTSNKSKFDIFSTSSSLSLEQKKSLENLDILVNKIIREHNVTPKPFSLKMESCFEHIPPKDYSDLYKNEVNLNALELSNKLFKEMKSILKWTCGNIPQEEINDHKIAANRVDESINKAQIYFNLIKEKKYDFIENATKKEKDQFDKNCKFSISCLIGLIKNSPLKSHSAPFDKCVGYINDIKDPIKVMVLENTFKRRQQMIDCAEVTAYVICAPLFTLGAIINEPSKPETPEEKRERQQNEWYAREQEESEERQRAQEYYYQQQYYR